LALNKFDYLLGLLDSMPLDDLVGLKCDIIIVKIDNLVVLK
jgi:hypothetical protein